jgi:zinc/manganese transport system substrate-binding protein
MRTRILALIVAAVPWALAPAVAQGAAAPAPVAVVAAESTYGLIAQAVGGSFVQVHSVIHDPNVDPHEFEASPRTAREVARASIVLMNGMGYDDWMRRMLAANPSATRQVVVAAQLERARLLPDGNPHLFYDTQVAGAMAARVEALLAGRDPAHASYYAQHLAAFRASLEQVDARVARLRSRYPGLKVTATEPVYGYMLRALGWVSLGNTFQFNVMNDTEPAPSVVARYEDELRRRRVSLLFYNRQVGSPLASHMEQVARSAGVPTVGVEEFAGPATGYAQWLMSSLDAVDNALRARPPAPR